jgi:hypothetical protein
MLPSGLGTVCKPVTALHSPLFSLETLEESVIVKVMFPTNSGAVGEPVIALHVLQVYIPV